MIGAGIHGLCAAFHLRRRGLQVTLLEAKTFGHAGGSSHGKSRITRSSYHDERYVRLAAQAHTHGWPLLERELGGTLVHRTPGLFFGPDRGLFGDYVRATLGSGAPVERISVAAARVRFPLLAFAETDTVLLDHTAGLLAAEATLRGLLQWCRDHGVDLREQTPVQSIQSEDANVLLRTAHGDLRARRVVLACGAWLPKLLPSVPLALNVIEQHVGYVDVAAPAAAKQVGTFPVWARIGADASDFRYGLPEWERPGLKCAQHITVGPQIDPDRRSHSVDEAPLLELARSTFAVSVRGIVGSESCLYTVAPNEDLHVMHAPSDARIAVVAACSGHGFKFGPEIGRMAADLVCD